MKVTDEMVGSAADRFENAPNDCTLEEKLRDVLEAALADVPEPATERDYDEWFEQKARADAAEAKLAKVRAWRARYGLPQEGSDELDAILDEAP